MVRAILDGRKTQTRRIVKAKDSDPKRCITLSMLMANVYEWRLQDGRWFGIDGYDTPVCADCPYGAVGDRLWVRETFAICADNNIFYKADGKPDPWDGIKWKPSIHMPRRASRITIEITGVRTERLNDITEVDAIAEGAQCEGVPAALTNRGAFAKLWEVINGKGSWQHNPWVWVIEFGQR
jgi:hypothetical protein